MMTREAAEGSARCEADVRDIQFASAVEEEVLFHNNSSTRQKRQARMLKMHQAGKREAGCFDSRRV